MCLVHWCCCGLLCGCLYPIFNLNFNKNLLASHSTPPPSTEHHRSTVNRKCAKKWEQHCQQSPESRPPGENCLPIRWELRAGPTSKTPPPIPTIPIRHKQSQSAHHGSSPPRPHDKLLVSIWDVIDKTKQKQQNHPQPANVAMSINHARATLTICQDWYRACTFERTERKNFWWGEEQYEDKNKTTMAK